MPGRRPSPPPVKDLCLLVAAVCTSCGTRERSHQDSLAYADRFADRARLQDTLVLGGQDTVPVVRWSGMATSPRGHILVVDVSEGHALLYDSAGALLRVLGRKGEGPGEMSEPRFPVPLPNGHWAIGEGNGRVSVFSEDGAFLRSFRIEGDGISSLCGLSDGGFSATTVGDPRGVVLVVDSMGGNLRRLFGRELAPVTDDPRNGRWKTVTQYWHVVQGDTAYVFATVSDSMWIVRLATGEVSAHQVPVPGYTPPQLPAASGPPGPQAGNPFAWILQYPVAMGAWSGPGGLLGISFVKGVLAYGDSATLMVRHADGSWVALTDAPPVFATLGFRLLGLHQPDSDTAVLGLWSQPE